jgi:hypothetical protein
MIEEINYKCISYCEIPEEITEGTWISDHSCDCYITYRFNQDSSSNLDLWLIKNYPELMDTTFMIHIDY